MCRLLIFAGTTEGRLLAELCAGENISAFVSVTSEYGRNLLKESPCLKVCTARMDQEEMERFLRVHGIELVVDATHPYALSATKNIKAACESVGVRRVRCLREAPPEEKQTKKQVYVSSAEEAACFLAKQEGKIFLTTGTKELSAFTVLEDFEERVYARVLPSMEALSACQELGLPAKHVTLMQGPFSEEMNMALFHQTGAAFLVTKDSGAIGGFEEKLSAALKCGVTSVIIKRQEETGCASFEETCSIIRQFTGKKIDFHVVLAGIGPGNMGQMTVDVLKELEESDVLFGAPRILEAVEQIPLKNGRKVKKIPKYMPLDVIEELERCRREGLKKAAVLFSGDTGFYSGAKKVRELLAERDFLFSVLPGISSVSYLAAKLHVSLEDTLFLTAHGRDFDVMCIFKGGRKRFFLLMGGENGVGKLCRELCENGFEKSLVSVGENLSYPDERILRGTAENLKDTVFGPLCLMYIEMRQEDER